MGEAVMQPQPHENHQWLKKLVGEWTYEGDAPAGPDQPPMKFTGRETVRSIGNLWVVGEATGEMGGEMGTMIITLGFNPETGRFPGSWIGSMMNFMWHYDGELNEARTTLTLNAVGPAMGPDCDNMDTSRTQNYQDIIEFVNDDHRILRSKMQLEDGSWVQFMESHYRRVK